MADAGIVKPPARASAGGRIFARFRFAGFCGGHRGSGAWAQMDRNLTARQFAGGVAGAAAVAIVVAGAGGSAFSRRYFSARCGRCGIGLRRAVEAA